jgi:transglutaminase-like putative cysteine protease
MGNVDLPAPPAKEIAPGARLAPTPDWVDLAPYQIPETANPHFIANGLCALLDESQIDLCGPDRAWFHRRAEMVTAAAGAEHAAQFSVTFDPAFERVEVHSIAVVRNGERIEHAPTAFFEVLRRERNLERLQFDGRLTAHVTIPDVRMGDVVETSHTRYGERKALGGRHSSWLAFEWGVGIVDVRVRRRGPQSRTIRELPVNDPPAATESIDGEIVDRRWTTFERPGCQYERLTPPWTLQSASLQLSEWSDWAEVAAAFTPLYEDGLDLPPDIEVEVARIAAEEPTPAGRAAAVLRFTQGAFRYLAISMGEGGYTPRPLSDVSTMRYGDCKDKSKLYVAIARRLGVDACATLVNTEFGYALAELLPSATLFDHCIVRVAIGDNIYWLDPTRQVQPSPLDKLSQSHYGWALPLKPGIAALERMPEPPVLHISETREHVTLGDRPDASVRYQWEHTFRHTRAEMVREQFAREGSVGVFKAYAQDIQRIWPKARVVSQELVGDDIVNNLVAIRELYEIDDAWQPLGDNKFQFTTHDLMLRGSLLPIDRGDRKHPIVLGMPGRRTRKVEVHTPMPHSGNWERRSGLRLLSFSDELRLLTPHHLALDQTLVIGGLALPASDAETYRQVVDGLDKNDLVVVETLRGKKFTASGGSGRGDASFWEVARWIWVVVIVLAVLARCAVPGG